MHENKVKLSCTKGKKLEHIRRTVPGLLNESRDIIEWKKEYSPFFNYLNYLPLQNTDSFGRSITKLTRIYTKCTLNVSICSLARWAKTNLGFYKHQTLIIGPRRLL